MSKKSCTENGMPSTTVFWQLSRVMSTAHEASKQHNVLTCSCVQSLDRAVPSVESRHALTDLPNPWLIGERGRSSANSSSCGAPSSLRCHHCKAAASSLALCRSCQSEKSAYCSCRRGSTGLTPRRSALHAWWSSLLVKSVDA